jgi:hypothetical protein
LLDLIQLVANQPILDEWHEKRTPLRQQTFMQIGINMAEAKKQLPATSTVNTTILKYGSLGTTFHLSLRIPCLHPGLTNTQAAEAFDLSTRAIANAKNDESDWKEFSQLSLPKVERNRMKSQRPLLDEYFASVQPVSGLFSFFYIRFILM